MVVPRQAAYNILRPETAEALFVLHQLTGDPIYRDWSFEIFEVGFWRAFVRRCFIVRMQVDGEGVDACEIRRMKEKDVEFIM